MPVAPPRVLTAVGGWRSDPQNFKEDAINSFKIEMKECCLEKGIQWSEPVVSPEHTQRCLVRDDAAAIVGRARRWRWWSAGQHVCLQFHRQQLMRGVAQMVEKLPNNFRSLVLSRSSPRVPPPACASALSFLRARRVTRGWWQQDEMVKYKADIEGRAGRPLELLVVFKGPDGVNGPSPRSALSFSRSPLRAARGCGGGCGCGCGCDAHGPPAHHRD